jgi:creatinine amidohydrolase/Fe(II)-dependent formamide hydrolase-like protein
MARKYEFKPDKPRSGVLSKLHLTRQQRLRILKWLNASLEKVMIMILRRGDHWMRPKDPRMSGGDFHAGDSETSLMLAYRSHLVQMDQLELDEPALAERMRHDQDAYQICTTLSGQPQEISTTRQRSEIKVGVMGYPEFATAERGRENVECAISIMADMVKKAIADADENRRTGNRIEVKSPVLVVEDGSNDVAIKQ